MEHRNEGRNEYLEQKGSKLSEKMIGISEMSEKILQALIADWFTEHFLIHCKYTLYVDVSELYDSVSQTMFCGTLMSSRW